MKWLRMGAPVAGIAMTLALSWHVGASAQEAMAPPAVAAISPQQQAYCRQLERQLPPDWQQTTSNRDLVPKLEAQIAHADQAYQHSQAAAERADCFDYFLFSKTWRDTAQCRQLHQQSDDAQRALGDLDQQRKGATTAQDRASRQDALLNELARNQCGPQYDAAVQRRYGAAPTAGYWNDSEAAVPGSAMPGFENLVPGSTFRTLCVRLCDGYYFPISFATTQERLQHDAQVCQNQCGGPAKLYYYPNPGGEVQQAVGLDGTPYTALKNAFRYRKELVSSCTCRGPADGSDAAANAQDQSQDGSAPADAVNSGALGQFGTMSVEPEPGADQNN